MDLNDRSWWFLLDYGYAVNTLIPKTNERTKDESDKKNIVYVGSDARYIHLRKSRHIC